MKNVLFTILFIIPVFIFGQNCRFDQCHGKTRAGNRCKSCVSSSGDTYCHNHFYQGGSSGSEIINIATYVIPDTREDCHYLGLIFKDFSGEEKEVKFYIDGGTYSLASFVKTTFYPVHRTFRRLTENGGCL